METFGFFASFVLCIVVAFLWGRSNGYDEGYADGKRDERNERGRREIAQLFKYP
jgi:hypothetical protein